MGIVETIIKRPITPIIIFSLVVIVGLVTLVNIGVELFPEVSFPTLTVSTILEDASPREMEKNVTEVLEGSLGNTPRLESISSEVKKGASTITLEFEYGTDLDDAANSVRDRLGLVETFLPSGAQTQVLQFDTGSIPVMVLSVSAPRDSAEIYEIADDSIRPLIERLDGVAQSFVVGGDESIVRVEVPLDRLEAYDVTLTEISQLFLANNTEVFGGELSRGSYDYIVETSGQFEDIEDIRNAVVGYRRTNNGDSYPIRISDIADVYFDFEARSTQVYVNGNPSVYVGVQKKSSANAVQVSDNVKALQEEILRILPPDFEVNEVWDSSIEVRNSLTSVSESAAIGAVLAILVLLFFLRSIRTTFVIACSVPVSLVVTLLAMNFFNLTLNVMTLAGLALGVGMLVDNSIVVLENIFRYRERGASLSSSALLGSKEMLTAISASTLTTVGVFFPLVLFRNDLGLVGELFTSFVITVTVALLTSLIVAMILVPVLSSHYFKLRSNKQRKLKGIFAFFDSILERSFLAVEKTYKRFLSFLLRHRFFATLGVILVSVGLIFLFPFSGFNFLPESDGDRVDLRVNLPPGTQADITRNLLFSVEQTMKEQYGAENITTTLVEIGEPVRGPGVSAQNNATGALTMILSGFEERTASVDELISTASEKMTEYPFAEYEFSEGGGFSGLSTYPLEIFIKGQDFDEMGDTAEQILAIMEEDERIINPFIDETEPLLQLNVDIDRERAYNLGLNVRSIGGEVNALLDGVSAGTLRLSNQDYDIKLSVSEENRDSVPDLSRAYIFTNQRQKIRLSNIASYRETQSPNTINRTDKSRYVRVVARTTPGITVDTLVGDLQKRIQAEVPLLPGILIEYRGDYEETQELLGTLMVFAILSALIVFGIMASLFESFVDPFIIIFTIPLSLAGVFFIYGVTGAAMNAFTAIGLIMLIGIVVNTGIVLVDYTNLLRKRGLSLLEAGAEAGRSRLRPILMTTLTTICGMAPLAFRSTEGSSLITPIALTVVGGLISATILTLFFIPVLYAIFNVRIEKRKKKKAAKLAARQQKLKEEQASVLEGA